MTENEKKQIEEMAKVIEITEQIARDAHCGLPSPTMYAKDLYWKGYRKQEWISVDERLPDRDGRYLVAMKNGDNYHISTRKFRRADPPTWWKGVTFGRWARYTGGVRYWMPLPEAPKMKGGKIND